MTAATASLEDICRTVIPGYDPWADADGADFDETAAQLAIDFFSECLVHIEGAVAGQPFHLEPWQQAVVGNLFGWKRPDGTRRYRELLLYVPRKNGKTPLAAGIANYVFFCDQEPGAQCYCAAADRDQASLLYRHMKGMIEAEPLLSDRCTIYKATRSLMMNDDEESTMRVLSADADTKHGGNSHLVIIDELHAQPNRDLVDTLQTSFASANRKQPLFICITTADFDRPSICNEKHDYACKVRDGIIPDPAFLPVIYEASRDDDWADPETWAKANPNLGTSVSEEYMRRDVVRAQESAPYLNTFLRLHLNVKTQNDVAWIDMARWDACGAVPVSLEQMAGRECWAGLDLSSTTDITALSLVFPDDGGYVVLPFFWIPSDNAKHREDRDRVPYLTWARQGLVSLTDGSVVDYDVIRSRINELSKVVNIRQIAVDRWNSTGIVTQLMGDGFDVVMFGQGFSSMSGPTKQLDKLIRGGQVQHGGNPALRWMASNVTVQEDAAGNLKPDKAKSTEKIDGIVATVMALGIGMVQEPNQSVYDRENRGFLEIG